MYFCTNKTSETNKVRIDNKANVKTNKNANIERNLPYKCYSENHTRVKP